MAPSLPESAKYLCCVLLGLGYFIFHVIFPIDYALISPDSGGYIHMSSQRSTGYPLFLWACHALGLPLKEIVWVQLALFSIGLTFLCIQLSTATRTVVPALVIGGVCAINPELNKYAFAILTETVFAALLMIYAGVLVRAIQSRAPFWLGWLAFVAGLLYAVRPVGAAVAVATLMVALFVWRSSGQRRTRIYALALLPLALTIAAETGAKSILHGTTTQSLAGIHAFGKAGMVEANVPEGTAETEQLQALFDALEKDLAGMRRLIDAAPTPYVARHLSIYYESFVQYRFAMEERGAAIAAAEKDPLLQVGLQRLRYGLGGFAVLTYRHYFSLWNLYDATYPGHPKIYNAYIAANAPLPLSERYPEIQIPAKPTGSLGLIVRPTIQIMGLMTAMLAAMGLYFLLRPQNAPPLLAAAGMISLLIHGYCLLVALTGIGIPRYLLVLWPLIITALGLTVWHFIIGFVEFADRRE